MPKPTEQTSFSLALNQIHSEGVATAEEMAVAAGCSRSHMQDVVSICDPAQLSLGKAIELSHWLVDQKGETRQLEAMGQHKGFLGSRAKPAVLPPGLDVEDDDDLAPELMLLAGEVSRAQEAVKAGDRKAADDHMKNIQGIVNAMHHDAITPAK